MTNEQQIKDRIAQLRAEIDQRQAEVSALNKRLTRPFVAVVATYFRHWSEYEDVYESIDEAIGMLEAMSDNGDIGEHHVYLDGTEVRWEVDYKREYPNWTWRLTDKQRSRELNDGRRRT